MEIIIWVLVAFVVIWLVASVFANNPDTNKVAASDRPIYEMPSRSLFAETKPKTWKKEYGKGKLEGEWTKTQRHRQTQKNNIPTLDNLPLWY